jgi:cellulose synthase/poly-beta-1,6-N-acetylglucosamine synthase-like glycosyltransferase
MTPRVSVVIPVRNGLPYLRETLESVRCQTRRADEVVVVDNCSTDGTSEFLSTQTDVRLITQPESVSAPANWTTAARAATGDFVKVLCADDLLLPNCLQRQLEALLEYSGCVMTSARREVIGPHSEVLMKAIGHDGLQGVVKADDAILRGLSRGTNLFGEVSALMFRTAVLQSCLPWPDNAGYATDLAMYLKVLRDGDVHFEHEPLAQFRVTRSSWSFNVRSTQARDVLETYARGTKERSLTVSGRHRVSGVLFAYARQLLRSIIYLRVRKSTMA